MNKVKIYCGTAPFAVLKGYIRDLRPIWLLEEIGADYDAEYIDPRADTVKPEYLAMNPFGKVPVMKDGELTMFESAAICQYLADKYGKLIPKAGTLERFQHDQWLFAAVSNFEFNAGRIFACDCFLDKGAETDAKRANAIEMLDNWLPTLETQLATRPYLNGKNFQVCDLIMTTILRFMSEKDYLKKYPAVQAYVRGNMDRPAFQRASAMNGGK